MPHTFTEDHLVEQSAIGLFATLGWQTVSAMEEARGRGGILGRFATVEEMQAVLDACLLAYNRKRSHLGVGMKGRMPIVALDEGLLRQAKVDTSAASPATNKGNMKMVQHSSAQTSAA